MPPLTKTQPDRRAVRLRAWNLLLLLPFLMLVTPWFDAEDPQLFGLPFFYWVQFVWVFVGVAAVGVVYFATRDDEGPGAPTAPGDVDELDEGGVR